MYSPEVNARLESLRHKAAQRTISQEELAEAVRLLRQGRSTAVQAAARKRSAAVKQTRSADDLLGELEGL
jgi:hypothetical protein